MNFCVAGCTTKAGVLMSRKSRTWAAERSWEQKRAAVSAVPVPLEHFLAELGLAQSARKPVGRATQRPVLESSRRRRPRQGALPADRGSVRAGAASRAGRGGAVLASRPAWSSAVIGLALAVGGGLAANAISRNWIGLAPTPVGSWRRLATMAPRDDTGSARRRRPRWRRRPRTRRQRWQWRRRERRRRRRALWRRRLTVRAGRFLARSRSWVVVAGVRPA